MARPDEWYRHRALDDLRRRMRHLERRIDNLFASRRQEGPRPFEIEDLVDEVGTLRRLMDDIEEWPGDDPPSHGPPNNPTDAGDGSEDRTSERRWTDHRVSQVGATNGMLIALSGATVAFVAAFGNPTAGSTQFDPAASWITWAGLALAVVSAILGVSLALVRVENFRLTARRARQRRLEPTCTDSSKSKRDKLDTWTYRLLYSQIASWVLSAVAITLGNMILLL